MIKDENKEEQKNFDDKINDSNEKNKINQPISINEFINAEKIKIEIQPYKSSKGLFSNTIYFYLYLNQFNFKVKRLYSDFKWLYEYITKDYKSNIPEFPKESYLISYTLRYKDSEFKTIGEKLEELINFIVNDQTLKKARVVFDFVTIENEIDFQDIKSSYEKINFSTLLLNKNFEKSTADNTSYNLYNNNIFEEISFFNKNDFINENNEIRIQTNNIKKEISNYLLNENYTGLMDYCYECTKDEVSKQNMIDNLKQIYNEGKNNIYAKIDKFEILKNLFVFDYKNNNIYYKKIMELLKNINRVNNLTLDEYFTRINKNSEIIKNNLFGYDISEKLAEENLRHIRTFIDQNYKGQEKDAVEPALKEKHVEIINDYIKVIVDKYEIDKDKILKKLQDLKEEEDIEDQINIFIQSLNEKEQLYYDLLVQSIIEAPKSDSATKSWAIPIFKVLKKILGTIVSTAIVSFTGSKILTSISAGVGTSLVISDIKDLYIKKCYFSQNNEFRRLYHINQRNSYDKRWNIFKRNVNENVRKIVNPIKNMYYYIVDKKLLKIKEETKIGFDRYDEVNIKENAKIFLEKIKEIFFKQYKNKIEFKYKQNIIEMKKLFRAKEKKQYQEIKNSSDKKEGEINEKTRNNIDNLKKEYPQFKDDSYFSKQIDSVLGFATNVTDIFKTILFYNKKKKKNSEIRLEIINNYKYEIYMKKLDEISNNNEKDLYDNLLNEVKSLCQLNEKDKQLYSEMENLKNKKIKEAEDYFKNLSLDEIELINNEENIKNKEVNKYIIINNKGYEDYEFYTNSSYANETLLRCQMEEYGSSLDLSMKFC